MSGGDRMEEIRKRLEAATPGPWVKDGGGTVGHIKSMPDPPIMDPKGYEATPTVCRYDVFTKFGRDFLGGEFDDAFATEQRDAEFISHARQDIPYLLDRLAAAERRVEELEGDKK